MSNPKLIRVTSVQGHDFYINATMIRTVIPSDSKEPTSNGAVWLMHGTKPIHLTQTMEEVVALVNAAP